MQEEKFMTVYQLAEYLNVHFRTIYNMLWSKKLPASKVGNQWRFRKEEIDKWIQEHRV